MQIERNESKDRRGAIKASQESKDQVFSGMSDSERGLITDRDSLKTLT